MVANHLPHKLMIRVILLPMSVPMWTICSVVLIFLVIGGCQSMPDGQAFQRLAISRDTPPPSGLIPPPK